MRKLATPEEGREETAVRWKCAIGLWVWAACILLWASKYVEPLVDWRAWIADAWQFFRAALLAYAGFLLVASEEELKASRSQVDNLEAIIGALQR